MVITTNIVETGLEGKKVKDTSVIIEQIEHQKGKYKIAKAKFEGKELYLIIEDEGNDVIKVCCPTFKDAVGVLIIFTTIDKPIVKESIEEVILEETIEEIAEEVVKKLNLKK